MKRIGMGKYYLLYSNKNQDKLLTTASNEEEITSESEYYITGVWFSYEYKENSNLLENEKEMKGMKFPAEAKSRYTEGISEKKMTFKWVA